MKRVLGILIFLSFLFSACTRLDNDADSILEIRELMFISQIDEINLNYRNYLGRTIRLEGIFSQEHSMGRDWYYVLRNTPGCCGDDGQTGFIVTWDQGGLNSPRQSDSSRYPAPDEWVEAIGELRHYNAPGLSFLYLALTDLNVLETRGLRFVFR